MRRGAALAWTAAVALAAAGPARAAAQVPTVEVTRPAFDARLRSATPDFTVVARDVVAPQGQVSVVIQVATQSTFGASIVFADTVAGDSADFVPPRPLPSATSLYWRGIALLDGVPVATSPVTGPRLSARWLELLAPDAPNGVILETRRPTFVWRSAPVAAPPGPWRYDLTITNVGTGASVVVTDLADTTFVPAQDLDANTSYRWSVRAHLVTGDQIRVASLGSFVIAVREQPLVTLLYQNFPNPFPTTSSAATCVWFDLAREADVRLEVLTLRGDRVRVIYPTRADFPQLRAGRYGRATVGSDTGCDPRFTWDGRSDTGARAAPGVYLLRLRAGREVSVRKVLYRGS